MAIETTSRGSFSQFGNSLQHGTERVCCGLGSFYHMDLTMPRFILPTDTFDDTMSFELAGN